MLRKFLNDVHSAKTSHILVSEIDNALCTGNFDKLMKITNLKFVNLAEQ